MKLHFDKYHGAGNDFIIFDNRHNIYNDISVSQLKKICDRHFGIGADGIILIESHSNADFEMKYYNSDGKLSSLCGNGGRCAVSFALRHDIIKAETVFMAADGLHKAYKVHSNQIRLQMQDVFDLIENDNAIIINTGSPHYVKLIQNYKKVDMNSQGGAIRFSKQFMPNGINVNFVQKETPVRYKIKTYERGVENETLACGTGAVACAIGMHYIGESKGECKIELQALGGLLIVDFDVIDKVYTNIYLQGPAEFVYSGIIEI